MGFKVQLGLVLVLLFTGGSTCVAQTVDCRQVGDLPSCHSYKQMVEDHDKDVQVSGDTFGVVCFREEQDAFVLVTFPKWSEVGWTKREKGRPETEVGYLFYQRFRNGLSDDSRFGVGEWVKRPMGLSPRLRINNSELGARVDDTEISIGFSYPNAAGSTTDYMLAIRRSTLRFVETFAGHAPASANAKSKASPPPEQFQEAGQCMPAAHSQGN